MKNVLAALLALVVAFAALAKGAHDLWAATLVYLVLGGAALVAVVRSSWPRSSGGFVVPFAGPSAVLTVAFLASWAMSVNPSESLLELLDWTAAYAAFSLSLVAFRSDRRVEWLAAAVVAVLVVQCGVHIATRLGGHYLWSSAETAGTLINANVQAAFVLLWLPLLAEKTFSPRRAGRPIRLFWGAGVLASLLILFFSGSAWAFGCLLATLPFVSRRLPAGRRTWVSAFIGLGVFLLFTLKGGMEFKGLEELRRWVAPHGSADRLAWWSAALRMWLDHPWFGIGLGNFASAYLAYAAGAGEQHTLFAHSLPLTLLAEIGLVGTGAVALWGTVFVRSMRGALGDRWPLALGLLLFAAFSAASLGPEFLGPLLAAAVAMGVVAAPALRFRPARPSRAVVILIIGAAAAALPFLVSPFFASRNVLAGREFLEEGNLAAAGDSFQGAAQLDPLSWEARQGLALWSVAASTDPAGAEAAVVHQQDAIRRNRLNARLWWELGRYQRTAGRPVEARSSFERAVNLHRTNAVYRRELEENSDDADQGPSSRRKPGSSL